MMIKRPQLTLPARTVSLAAIPGVSLDLEAPETAREGLAPLVRYEIDIEAGTLTQKANLQ